MYHNLENIKRLNLNLLYFYVILWMCIIYYLLLSKNATYKYTYNFMFNKNKKIFISFSMHYLNLSIHIWNFCLWFDSSDESSL